MLGTPGRVAVLEWGFFGFKGSKSSRGQPPNAWGRKMVPSQGGRPGAGELKAE